jgi:DNA polymerase sigma
MAGKTEEERQKLLCEEDGNSNKTMNMMRKILVMVMLAMFGISMAWGQSPMKKKLEEKYGSALELTSDGKKWYVVGKSNEKGAADDNGKLLIPLEFDDVSLYYKDKYIQLNLQRDLLDFQEYVKEKLKYINPKISELINLIQLSVNESIGKEYEVKLYGSHATNLCLPWSDLDVVICKRDNTIGNSYTPLYDLFKNLQDKNYFKTINYIGATTVPLIKIKTNGNFGVASVDISLQDNNHYGIQCVSLVNFLIQKYPVLTPMVLALKHILKQANLNDPYKVYIYFYLIFFYRVV